MGRFLCYSLKAGARLWFQQPEQLNSEVQIICPTNGDTGLLSGLLVCFAMRLIASQNVIRTRGKISYSTEYTSSYNYKHPPKHKIYILLSGFACIINMSDQFFLN